MRNDDETTSRRSSTERRVGSAVLQAAAVGVTFWGIALLWVVVNAYLVEWRIIAPPRQRGADLDFAELGPLIMACVILAVAGGLAVLGSLLFARRRRYWVMQGAWTGIFFAIVALASALEAPAWSWGLSWGALVAVMVTLAVRARDA